MDKVYFKPERGGFYGVYYPNPMAPTLRSHSPCWIS